MFRTIDIVMAAIFAFGTSIGVASITSPLSFRSLIEWSIVLLLSWAIPATFYSFVYREYKANKTKSNTTNS